MHLLNEYIVQGNPWLFFPMAVFLGVLHGLEPGHSKTMMTAFIIGIRGTVWQAFLLGIAATLFKLNGVNIHRFISRPSRFMAFDLKV